MSDLLYEAEQALVYTAPAESPALVLAVAYGEQAATPDPIDTVDVFWTHRDRPGVFVANMVKTGDWQHDMDALLRVEVYVVESLYALLGGWPEPTPLPTDFTPPPGVVYLPAMPPGYVLPPGIIGIE